MKERGMIFNAEMVRAILDGRKKQTRRIMKVQPSEDFTPMNMALEPDYKARWYTPGTADKDGYLQPANKEVFGVANENEGIHARSAPSATASGCVKHFRGRYSITSRWRHSSKIARNSKSQSFVSMPLTAAIDLNIKTLTTICVTDGAHLSICRAGPAAFCWKSPTCVSSGSTVSAKKMLRLKAWSLPDGGPHTLTRIAAARL